MARYPYLDLGDIKNLTYFSELGMPPEVILSYLVSRGKYTPESELFASAMLSQPPEMFSPELYAAQKKAIGEIYAAPYRTIQEGIAEGRTYADISRRLGRLYSPTGERVSPGALGWGIRPVIRSLHARYAEQPGETIIDIPPTHPLARMRPGSPEFENIMTTFEQYYGGRRRPKKFGLSPAQVQEINKHIEDLGYPLESANAKRIWDALEATGAFAPPKPKPKQPGIDWMKFGMDYSRTLFWPAIALGRLFRRLRQGSKTKA